MQPLNPVTIELSGHSLIEAGAGTGKTYTLVLLYLRLVLERQLPPESILVVTFTVNATEELRGRIRDRIREAIDCLTGRLQTDGALQAILEQHAPDKALVLLQDALGRMDEAAVYTIHSFCQRILQDHAFACSMSYSSQFIEQEDDLRREIIQDYWRLCFHDVDSEKAAWILSCWQGPQELLNILKTSLHAPNCTLVPEIRPERLKPLQADDHNLLRQIKKLWPKVREEILNILSQGQGLKKNKSKGYSEERKGIAIKGMDRLYEVDAPAWLLPQELEILSYSHMQKQRLAKKEFVDHDFFHLMDDYLKVHDEFLQWMQIHILYKARSYLIKELADRKEQRGLLSFNDLLEKLLAALAGEGGPSLARRIARQFPAAMVDEFQDTDSCQYDIFRRIYTQEKKNGLLMIGDPKQAIYSFRGADLFTYLKVKKQTPATKLFTLDTNYRSTDRMVGAINMLFSGPNPFLQEGISHIALKSGAQHRNAEFILEGEKCAPLQMLSLPLEQFATNGKSIISKETATLAAAKRCAAEVQRLLVLAGKGQAQIGSNKVEAGDIAILVRTHQEAAQIKKALAGIGISSVYQGQDSVFATEAARTMLILLSAIATPASEKRVRRCLLTPVFGYNANELAAAEADDLAWENRLSRMENYHKLWHNDGFTAMWLLLLEREKAVARILASQDGERFLTDLLHLAELIEEEQVRLQGMEMTLQWLNTQIAEPDGTSTTQQRRLESDENLVQILTIHKAKGLEFPIVFIPFPWACRTVQPKDILRYHSTETLEPIIDFGSGNENAFVLAEKERLAEDLRLFYVAVTRAVYCCYFSWGQINKMELSAAAYTFQNLSLAQSSSGQDQSQPGDVFSFLHKEGFLAIHERSADSAIIEEEKQLPELIPAFFRGIIDSSWGIASFSSLISGHDPHPDRPDRDPDKQEEAASIEALSRFTFPRGTAAGTFLHDLLEHLEFSDLEREVLWSTVEEKCKEHGFDSSWQPVLTVWLEEIIRAPLDNSGEISLQRVSTYNHINEMAFHFPLHNLDTASFAQILKTYDHQPIPANIRHLHGMMKGYIDLVFRSNGRYYLADYKSNHLGNTFTDYTQSSLREAMLSHRYDLQYLIYSLALHRYLNNRLPGYDFKRHFGGAYYLFLRGMHPNQPAGNGVYFDRPSYQLIDALDKACGVELSHG